MKRIACFTLLLPLLASVPAVAQQRDLTGAVANWFRGAEGKRITVVCPPKKEYGKAFGTDVYTDDSSICAAAAHAGVISPSEGGATTAVITGGKKSYRGSTRNGVTSGDFAASSGSFTVERGDGGGIDWNTKAFGLEVLDRPLAVVCPPGVSKHGVWGTDIYTDDTPICAAAAHAGLITSATGGRVVVEGAGGQPSFLGTSRNGIKSEAYGEWPRSFRFDVVNLPTAPVTGQLVAPPPLRVTRMIAVSALSLTGAAAQTLIRAITVPPLSLNGPAGQPSVRTVTVQQQLILNGQ